MSGRDSVCWRSEPGPDHHYRERSGSGAGVGAGSRRQGVGAELVGVATREARAAGCGWLHVDFEEHLRAFYFDTCGFRPTDAGLISL